MIRLLVLLALGALVELLATWHVLWAPFYLLGMAWDLISEALWISWARDGSRTGQGTAQWAGLYSRSVGSIVLAGSRDPGNGVSGW